jgi:hypothetical protein
LTFGSGRKVTGVNFSDRLRLRKRLARVAILQSINDSGSPLRAVPARVGTVSLLAGTPILFVGFRKAASLSGFHKSCFRKADSFGVSGMLILSLGSRKADSLSGFQESWLSLWVPSTNPHGKTKSTSSWSHLPLAAFRIRNAAKVNLKSEN